MLLFAKVSVTVAKSITRVSHLGDRLRSLREGRKLAQEELAEVAGIARTTISAVERGKPIRFDTLRRITGPLKPTQAEWLAVVIDWIRLEIGRDFEHLTISAELSRRSDYKEIGAGLARLIETQPPTIQAELQKLLQRPELLALLRPLNAAYERIKTS